jgi:hypothetical protein
MTDAAPLPNNPIADGLAKAKQFLKDLGFDKTRTNDRSAYTLLVLLNLDPGQPWSEAEARTMGVHSIRLEIAVRWEKEYAVGSRESIRKFTLHQFVEAGLCLYNPDDPARAVNSQDNSYQVTPEAVDLAQRIDDPDYPDLLVAHLEALPGLVALYGRAREQALIPVTLPDGKAITLSGGGQNVLIKQIIDEFCPRWLGGGEILYIGDTAKMGDPVFDEDRLLELDVILDHHGQLPDLIVYLPDKKWLVLMEAVTSHGPVDGKRYNQLRHLFEDSSAGLVMVSCFASRTAMRRWLSEIAWETEAWCAEDPSHLIHFNGKRFLGPYE